MSSLHVRYSTFYEENEATSKDKDEDDEKDEITDDLGIEKPKAGEPVRYHLSHRRQTENSVENAEQLTAKIGKLKLNEENQTTSTGAASTSRDTSDACTSRDTSDPKPENMEEISEEDYRRCTAIIRNKLYLLADRLKRERLSSAKEDLPKRPETVQAKTQTTQIKTKQQSASTHQFSSAPNMSSMTSDLREMAKDETAKLKMVLNELIRKKIAEEVIKRLKDLDLLSLVSPSPTASKTSANQTEANDETTPKHKVSQPQDQNTATESSAQAGPSKISKEESPKLSKNNKERSLTRNPVDRTDPKTDFLERLSRPKHHQQLLRSTFPILYSRAATTPKKKIHKEKRRGIRDSKNVYPGLSKPTLSSYQVNKNDTKPSTVTVETNSGMTKQKVNRRFKSASDAIGDDVTSSGDMLHCYSGKQSGVQAGTERAAVRLFSMPGSSRGSTADWVIKQKFEKYRR
ncbi:uncharacterized protein LOC143464764 isoform X2 [Clavelina lepadiformis]|uniref:uncharacterized protein LOC143464764 isoform X2 n=1 Tax=Clavelina lepadiformis TaxID=159417 RepID=UPI004042907E